MEKFNELLARIELQRMWSHFHKDWLMQIRERLRPQLSEHYRILVESETVLISPEFDVSPPSSMLPDVAVTRRRAEALTYSVPEALGTVTAAIVEFDEPCESETHYSLVIRRSPENVVVAALELLSPSNKGVGNTLDREKHLRKRLQFLDAGVNLFEIDALRLGTRDLPYPLETLSKYERVAWIADHAAGRRRYRGWGWNQPDPLPVIDWPVDEQQTVLVDLAQTLAAAVAFNRWDSLIAG